MAATLDTSGDRGATQHLRKLGSVLVVLMAVTLSTTTIYILVQTGSHRIIFGYFKVHRTQFQDSIEFSNKSTSDDRGLDSTSKDSLKFLTVSKSDDRDLASAGKDSLKFLNLPRRNNESITKFSSTRTPRTLQILFWHKDLGSPLPVSLPNEGQCVFTSDTSRYDSSDAVVYQGDRMTLQEFPRRRKRYQKWVYRSMEPPTNVFPYSVKLMRLKRQRNLYNLTSTYESTSDVPTPYFDGNCSIDGRKTANMNDSEMRLFRDLISNKTRPVAWFVTHCSTSSRRERYVSQLRRYIPVDIFGGCGTHHCPLERTGNVFSRCDDLLERNYRFYLSFENSLCTDYITEKFWRLLNRDVLPVTLGGADYRKYVPQGTYVDVRDFRSPRHLADYLWTLTRRDDLYTVFLERKRRLRCTSRSNYFATKLCSYLFSHAEREQKTDLSARWNLTKMCQTPKTFYRGIAKAMDNK